MSVKVGVKAELPIPVAAAADKIVCALVERVVAVAMLDVGFVEVVPPEAATAESKRCLETAHRDRFCCIHRMNKIR